MSDMPAIQELSDARLAELAKTDLERAQDKVFALEVKLTTAKAAHNRNFPRGATNPEPMKSLQVIDRIAEDLSWAKKRLALIEAGVRSVELQRAREEAPEVSRTFEVVCDDGRKAHRQAKDSDTASITD